MGVFLSRPLRRAVAALEAMDLGCRPRRARGWRMRCSLVALAVVVLTACAADVDEGEIDAGVDPPSETSPTTVPNIWATDTTKRAPQSAKVGDKVSLQNGDTIQVRSYTPNVPAPNQFFEPDPGNSFAAVDVEACAGPDSSNGVASTFDFELQMPDNTRMDATFMPAKEPELKSGALAAGDCIRGWVSFEVPTGAKPAAVVFSDFDTSLKWAIP